MRSPLLIPRGARSAGGAGRARRVVLTWTGEEYVVAVAGDVSREYRSSDELPAVQAFNSALEDAERAGLTAVPAPATLHVDELRALRRAMEGAGD
ncbi:hypothetical protein DSM112329_03263 [Paraconexibacter sp. AEG42_29]|uniref:Uncharacterized protein n=2 Tax=Paraconexibacter sp. AEG42_29 TaxID=2997339 RepID=A0AAU7AXN2_9ACTN